MGIDDAERRMRQDPLELSGGLLQRVMITAGLLSGPKLLLADEPTTALDVIMQADVLALTDELRRGRGTALIFVTHDIDLALAICDRILVLYAGRVLELIHTGSDAIHPYTRGLLDSRPPLGKSTIGAVLAGLVTASSGQVLVCGEDRGRVARSGRERRRRAAQLQLVPQDPAGSLDPRQRVGSALAEAVLLHREHDPVARVSGPLVAVGLSDPVEQAVGQAGRAEPAVAAGRRRPATIGFEHDDIEAGVEFLGLQGGPQPGVAAADHHEVGAGARKGVRRVGRKLVTTTFWVGAGFNWGRTPPRSAVPRRSARTTARPDHRA